MPYTNFTPLLEVTRGPIVESVHYGVAAVVDSSGRLIASYGDPQTVTYLRSSAKPFQALPLIELGGAEAFGLSDKEIAVTCASHQGTDDHYATVSSIQKKAGIKETDLRCGVHTPFHRPTADALVLRGEQPTPNRHNCSGKHTGMLAQAVLRQLPIEDYLNPQHPVQQADLMAFSEMCGVDPGSVKLGTDGCSAPVFAVSMYNAALGFARLVDPCDVPDRRAAACRHIVRAMTSHPDMVSGPEGFDTLLMEFARGQVVTKGGAEGYQAAGVLPGVLGPGSPGLGITLKISDGDPTGRARALITLDILRQLGVFTEEQIHTMPHFGDWTVYNWRKLDVGEMRPFQTLTWHQEPIRGRC